ncbi:hypothetical protein ACFXTN_012838 [Malus domestica]
MLELQYALKINESLKKEMVELQCVRVGMLEENKQLKGDKAGLEASLVQSQADFYKLGYIDHLFGRPSDFKFTGKDFKFFFISPKNLLAFTFEASISEVVKEVGAQARVAEGEALDNVVAKSVVTTEGVATE